MTTKYPLLLSGILLLMSSCFKGKDSNEENSVTSPVYQPLPDPVAWKDDWKNDQIVTVQTLTDPDNLHPVNGTSQARTELNLYLHVSLLQTDLRTSEIRSGLCVSLPEISKDQLKLTFELRREPRWDDGTPITAADVIFTTKASKCPQVNNPATKPYFENVQDIVPDAVNSRKFTVIMKRPYFQNMGIWCDYPIIQRAKFDSANVLRNFTMMQFDDSAFNANAFPELVQWSDWFNTIPGGTDPSVISGAGPYEVDKWEPGQYISLQLKQKHWTLSSTNYWEKSYPKQIIYHLNRDASSQLLAFKGQEYDASTSISARTLLDLQSDSVFNSNYHSAFINTYGYTYIALNMKPSPGRTTILTDKAVRKALAHAVPVDQIIQVVNKGVNKRVAGPVSFLKSSCDTSLALIPFDPKKAGDLLAAAGWMDTDKDGFRDKEVNGKKTKMQLELAYLSIQTEWKEMAIMIREGMAQAGVDVIATGFDFPVWLDKTNTREFDMLMGAWNNTAMPDDFSQLWSSSSFSDGGINFTGFGNAESDALIDSINVKMLDAERLPYELRLQKILYEEQPYIFMYGLVRRSICHRRFSGAAFFAERPGILYNTFRVLPGNRPVVETTP
jgi:peptide/nickel transport system substrate-binding protein